jgi:hypothetical protein
VVEVEFEVEVVEEVVEVEVVEVEVVEEVVEVEVVEVEVVLCMLLSVEVLLVW